jgi:DNA-binding PadR family transcriptional regulator
MSSVGPPRLREPTYFILAALLDGPLHGYGIIRRAAELSDGAVRPTAGTLYGALDRLADQGLVVVDREETVSGRRRRYYRVTSTGAAALTAEAARMRRAVAAVERRGVAFRGVGQPG